MTGVQRHDQRGRYALLWTDGQVATGLLTTEQVAGMFRVAGRTVKRWAARGVLEPVRIGGTTRYRADEVNALIASSKRVPGVIGLVQEAQATSLYAMHMELVERLAGLLGVDPEALLSDDQQEDPDDR